MMCAIGCEQPEYVDSEDSFYDSSSNYANSYVFDISVLSEWSGNILPYQATMKFVLRNENNDGQTAKCYLGNSEFDCTFTQNEGNHSSQLVVSYDLFKYDEIHKRIHKPNEETQDIQSHTLTCTPCPVWTHIPIRAFLPTLTAGQFIRMRKDTGYSQMC
jgi:hypothetical protein